MHITSLINKYMIIICYIVSEIKQLTQIINK